MAEHSSIEWTDATWNPITGCKVKSPGCANCYAMRLAGTRLRGHPSRVGLTISAKAGPVWNGEVRLNEQWLTQPLRWATPRDIFVVAHGDLFYESVPEEWIDKVFAVAALARRHRLQFLTKRTDRACAYLTQLENESSQDTAKRMAAAWPADHPVPAEGMTFPLSHALIGASVEDQRRADERREEMRAIAALGWRTWVSYEPALGPVDWAGWEFLSWMVSGGENGPRPSHPDWHRTTRDWCAAHGIPYHFKQWGSWRPPNQGEPYNTLRDRAQKTPSFILEMNGNVHCAIQPRMNKPVVVVKVGKKAAGRLLDGQTHDGAP